MTSRGLTSVVFVHGTRCAVDAEQSDNYSLEIRGGRIRRMLKPSQLSRSMFSDRTDIDLSGYLILPGLINAHDHLEFALFPQLGNPPYRNYVEWGADIHATFPEAIRVHRAVPKDVRVWWGGIRNLLCGVTTVAHHNPLRPEMVEAEFPVRVIRKYGWAHSVALGGDLRRARAATPEGAAFIVHACEGTDEVARQEISELDRLGLLDGRAILVHGLALDARGVQLMIDRQASLIVCPSSNHFLFETLPDIATLRSIGNLTLGNDSPLTAEGDLLDEVRFVIGACRVTPGAAWEMVTTAPAAILRLNRGEGTLQPGGVADLIAVKESGQDPGATLSTLAMEDVELVIIGGRIQLASEAIWERLPSHARHGLEPISVNGIVRWLRVPVSFLLRRAEQALGTGRVHLGTRSVSAPVGVGKLHVS